MGVEHQRIEVSEIYTAGQAEGPYMGRPSIFLRLRRCNLACDWCDSKFTWDRKMPEYRMFRAFTPPELAQALCDQASDQNHWPLGLVITGGEPLIWQRLLPEVIDLYKAGASVAVAVEVETAGTIIPSSDMLRRCHFNVSHKMPSSGNNEVPTEILWCAEAAKEFAKANAVYKIVIDPTVPEDAETFPLYFAWLLKATRLPQDTLRDRVYLMPAAATKDELYSRQAAVIELAMEYGVRYTTRPHILAYGGERGR